MPIPGGVEKPVEQPKVPIEKGAERYDNERNALLFISKLERVYSGVQASMKDSLNPYKNEFFAFFKQHDVANKKTEITGLTPSNNGAMIGFTDPKENFEITGNAYNAIFWNDIAARAEAEFKRHGKTFSKETFSAAVSKSGNTQAFNNEIIKSIVEQHIEKKLQMDYMDKKAAAMKMFEEVIKNTYKEMYDIFNDENLAAMGNEELSVRLFGLIKQNCPKDMAKYLDDFNVVVQLEIKGRKKDKESKPRYINIKSTTTRKGDDESIGVRMTVTDKDITVHGDLKAPDLATTKVEKLPPILETKRIDTIKEFKNFLNDSWKDFIKLHPEWFLPEKMSKGHRQILAQEYTNYLKVEFAKRDDLTSGIALLKTDDIGRQELHLPDSDSHFTARLVFKGFVPGVQMRWNSKDLVDETKDFYPISDTTIDKMPIERPLNESFIGASAIELEQLQSSGKANVLEQSHYEENKLKREMTDEQARKAETVEGNAKFESGKPLPKVPNFDRWPLGINIDLEGINPDKWDVFTDPGRANMRKEWILLGLPAAVEENDAFFEGIFNQFRKCKDPDFLKNLSETKQQWYKNPDAHMQHLKTADPPFHSAWQFFEQVKTQVNLQINLRKHAKETAEGAAKSPIEKAIDIPAKLIRENWKDFKTALRDGNGGRLAVFGLIGIGIYKLFFGKDSGGNPLLGKWKDHFSKLVVWGSVIGGGMFLAKNAGWDIFRKMPWFSTSLKDTPYGPLENDIPEAFDDGPNKLDGTVLVRAQSIKLASLNQEYQKSNDTKEIDPKLFRTQFPEFDGKSKADLKDDNNYKHVAHQLYLVIHYLKIAYNGTLKEKNPKYKDKSFEQALVEDPYNHSDVLTFAAGILQYGMKGEKGEYTVMADGTIEHKVNEKAAKALRDTIALRDQKKAALKIETDPAKKAILEQDIAKLGQAISKLDEIVKDPTVITLPSFTTAWNGIKNKLKQFEIVIA
ncbi:MAG: hypothetical protein WC269_01530 [Candidatus Gracilibacteria bacterium]|jgi:hypothetical protein